MAARLALRRHAAPAAMALVASGGLILYPRCAFAESPESQAILVWLFSWSFNIYMMLNGFTNTTDPLVYKKTHLR